MSTDISLLLERYNGDRWVPALELADRVSDPRTRLGILQVCWWERRQRPTTIFFGPDALIPFNKGLPDDLSPEVFNYVRWNFDDDPTYAGWISLADLALPLWSEQTVIVGGPVPFQYAELFGDGQQPPPIKALRACGFQDLILERLTDWKNDRQYCYQHLYSNYPKHSTQDSIVEVTWVEPLNKFIAGCWNEGLSGLINLENPEQYRIVTSVG